MTAEPKLAEAVLRADTSGADVVGGRTSIDKLPLNTVGRSPVQQHLGQLGIAATLPEELIQHILHCADPSTFASLVLINSKWWHAAQQARLYAAQLSRCPSFAASHKSFDVKHQHDLALLRRLFAREVKRNLFEAYLRPSTTNVKIISNSISSSSCPGGEGISFQPSPNGHHMLAYNSSRIYILDLASQEIEIVRELKVLRRPAATCIKDDGGLLAVLLSEMQVDIYDLTLSPPKRTQSLILDHNPRAIALSPCGSVLAAAYEGGIEVSSLDPAALDSERRSVKCDGVDTLTFSDDGTQILGTTVQSRQPNTVVLTAPYYDPGTNVTRDSISALWTTSILFPNSSRDCSHAVLLQESDHEEAAWCLTYDRSFETFRSVRVDDLRNGTTYFTGPAPHDSSEAVLLPYTLPTASARGELVAAGFASKDVWVYGIPEDLEAVPEVSESSSSSEMGQAAGLGRRISASSNRSPPKQQVEGQPRMPQWQVLCDQHRNTLIKGRKMAELKAVNTVKWVAHFGGSSIRERLVVTARGVVPPKPVSDDDEGMDFVDGGRLTLVDFDYSLANGATREITIEAGIKVPEALEEEQRDIDTEVAIVRRRTVAQGRGKPSAMIRAATSAARPTTSPQLDGVSEEEDDYLVPRRIVQAPPRSTRPTAAEEVVTETIIEDQEALDAPYEHGGPRTVTTLRRAATAAANHRRHNPQTSAGHPIEVRRADGRAEHPHESDADNWVPPPPPYQKEKVQDLPAFLRAKAVPGGGDHEDDEVTCSSPPPPLPQMPSSWRRNHNEESDESTGLGSDDSILTHPAASIGAGRSDLATSSDQSRSRDVEDMEEEEDIYSATPAPREPAIGFVGNDGTLPMVQSVSLLQPSILGPGHVTIHTQSPRRSHQQSGPARPLSNSQTWPLQHMSVDNEHQQHEKMPNHQALPVVHHGHPSHCNAIQIPARVPVGSRPATASHHRSFTTPVSAQYVPPPDQPLIISTPGGVAGAFDESPSLGQQQQQHIDRPIFAPVPRHARSTVPGNQPSPQQQPTAQNLEAGLFEPGDTQASSSPRNAFRIPSLRRKQSRAGRGARRSVSNANQKKGWRGRVKNVKPTGGDGTEVWTQPPIPQFFSSGGSGDRRGDAARWAGDVSQVSARDGDQSGGFGREDSGAGVGRSKGNKGDKGDKKCVIM